MERIPAEGWQEHTGHVDRYRWAAGNLRPGDVVNDVACGVGYGAALLGTEIDYHGYDRPDVVLSIHRAGVPGVFHPADLNDPDWAHDEADVTICFETLEHVQDPKLLAATLQATTRRVLLVSTPTEPTRHVNPWHLHDFTAEDIPPLFAGFAVVECWPQPAELSHVWRLERP